MSQQQGIVLVLNQQGEVVRGLVYRESPDGSFTPDGYPRLDVLIPTVNSQTREVTFFAADKLSHVVEYVLLGENTSNLGAREREALTHKPEGEEVTQVVDEGQGANTNPLTPPTPAPQSTGAKAPEEETHPHKDKHHKGVE